MAFLNPLHLIPACFGKFLDTIDGSPACSCRTDNQLAVHFRKIWKALSQQPDMVSSWVTLTFYAYFDATNSNDEGYINCPAPHFFGLRMWVDSLEHLVGDFYAAGFSCVLHTSNSYQLFDK